MNIHLSYGRDGCDVDLPETPGFAGVLRAAPAPAVEEPDQAVLEAVRAPMDSKPLRELARGRPDACVVVSDITRPVPNHVLLPAILTELRAAGMADDNILILIATGSHRPNEGDELVQLVGEDVVRRCRVANHRCRARDEMVLVGHIADGVPAYVNRLYVESDLKVLTGFIEPHLWAGFSGGRKSILPGVSALETLEYMHGPEMIAHEMTRYGALEENPFHEAGLAIMERAGADFIVNVTLTTAKEITGVFAGHPVEAHLAGCRFLGPHCFKAVDGPLDFVVTTNAGAPLDCNLYQSVKGMSGAAPVLRKGGTILSVTACYEGLGTEDFEKAMAMAPTPREFIDRVMAREFFISDQWCAQELYQLMLDYRIWVHTDGIPPETLRSYHITPAASVEHAVHELLETYGPGARWAVVPDGPLVILQLADAAAGS